jgi:hypothetical protein
MKKSFILCIALAGFWLACPDAARAWDYEGHRVISQLALGALPADFPAFVRSPAAQERIAFLSGEADRWRNVPEELPFSHVNGPDHYLDMEELDLYGLDAATLPVFRYDFAAKLALARAARPERFPPIDPARNRDHTRELIGFLPWTIAEYCGKLKSGFSYLKALQEGGTPEEIANAEQNIIYVMGVMAHFVGDSTQPLHTTIHHHGWVGENPHGYATDRNIHQWIDGDYFRKTGGLKLETMKGKIRPAQVVATPAKPEDLFTSIMAHLVEVHQQLEPLYQLYKDGKLTGSDEKGMEGKAFLEGQLVKGGQLLGNLWCSASQQVPEDKYLKDQLAKRKGGSNLPASKP